MPTRVRGRWYSSGCRDAGCFWRFARLVRSRHRLPDRRTLQKLHRRLHASLALPGSYDPIEGGRQRRSHNRPQLRRVVLAQLPRSRKHQPKSPPGAPVTFKGTLQHSLYHRGRHPIKSEPGPFAAHVEGRHESVLVPTQITDHEANFIIGESEGLGLHSKIFSDVHL